MIRFLSPGFAWALIAPAAVPVLYLLRRRFLPRQVPSVFLWQRSVRDYAANRPFQRLMKNLLLPLQLLAVLALALALMRPAVPGGTAGHTVLIFDVSGSMQTETAGKTRLETAKEEAAKLIQSLPAGERITVLTAGDQAERLVFSADREEAEKAVASVTCGRGGADISRALTLADAVAREEEHGASAVIFSDAARPEDLKYRGNALTLSIINSGRGEENRAVYLLTAEKGRAWARVANFGGDCTVTLRCEADGALCDAKELTIPAGETAGVGFTVPDDAVRVKVSLRERDALATDDSAETAVRYAAARKAAVLSDSVFLESALRVRPDLTVLRTEAEALASTEADLYVLGTSPLILTRRLPEGGYDPGADSFGGISWEEVKTVEVKTVQEATASGNPSAEITEDPLTAGLTLKNVYFRSWRPLEGGTAAVSLNGETVIARTEDTVVLGFDPHDTNLPLKYDFPVLIQNILDLLIPEETAAEEDAALMPLAESDVRSVAPDDNPAGERSGSEQGRDLTGILLGLFLLLAAAEMGVSRYVS